MDVVLKTLTALRHERERVSEAIETIERLTNLQISGGVPTRRRGRPPGSKNKPKVDQPQP